MYFIYARSIFFALGNKSESFCEAVNGSQSDQEGKFLFAMLVTFDEIYMFFLSHGSHNKAPIAH